MKQFGIGAGASRLLRGNQSYTEEVENNPHQTQRERATWSNFFSHFGVDHLELLMFKAFGGKIFVEKEKGSHTNHLTQNPQTHAA